MGKLRKTVQREILDALDTTSFTSDDFIVKFGNSDQSEYIFMLKFKHEENYIFWFQKLSSTSPFNYHATIRPGDIEEEQEKYFLTVNKAIEYLPIWCSEIRSDLKASQQGYDEIDKLRKSIEESIIGSIEDNGEFSVSEISELQKKFNDLLQRVSRLEEEQLITSKQLDEFKSGINQVSEDLEFYPKSTWVKTATNKLSKIIISIGKSKEGRQIISDGAKKLLGLD